MRIAIEFSPTVLGERTYANNAQAAAVLEDFARSKDIFVESETPSEKLQRIVDWMVTEVQQGAAQYRLAVALTEQRAALTVSTRQETQLDYAGGG